MQGGGGTRTHLFRDRKQWVAIHRQRQFQALDRLDGGEQHGGAGLVVQVAGVDETGFGHLRRGVDGDEVAHMDTQAQQILEVVNHGVDAEFDMVPTAGLVVDLRCESVAGSLEWQDGPPQLADVHEQGSAGTLRKARVPVAHRHESQPPVVLQPLHHGAQCVDMGHDGAVGL